MPRPVDEHRREEVLDQAIGFISEHGLAGLTMRKLATALGFSTNVISYQFGSKHGLVAATLDRSRDEQTAVCDRLLEADPEATAANAFVAIWDWWLAEPTHMAYARISIDAMLSTEYPDVETRTALFTYWADFLTKWLERDGHDAAAARELATLALTVHRGLIIDLVNTGDRERVTAAMHRFARLLEAPAN